MPRGELTTDSSTSEESRGQFLHLFGKKGQGQAGPDSHLGPHLTLSVFFLWFVAAASYYGFVLLSTEMLDSTKHRCSSVVGGQSATMEELEETECSMHICRC